MHLFPAGAGQVVSIHAPAWGATSDVPAPNMQALVSIHAPAWGATPAGWCRPRSGGTCFNPRTRVGCDFTFMQYPSPKGRVSIHAPAWGATAAWRCRPRWLRCFNPRTRVGCDGPGQADVGQGVMFQSTHPRGVRLGSKSRLTPSLSSFNPRTRVGCDVHAGFPGLIVFTFQSTHPRGVRRKRSAPSTWPRTFQSTHPRGVRHRDACLSAANERFNPRTRVGCDVELHRL